MPKKGSKYDGVYSVGHKFGDWELLETTTVKLKYGGGSYGEPALLVKCICGKERNVAATRLVKGQSTSCGCWFYGKGSDNPNWKGIGIIPGRYVNRVEYRAKERGLDYNLDAEYMNDLFERQGRACALSGVTLYFGDASSEYNTNASLDRIDSSLGYVKGNVQWLTKMVNMCKQSISQQEFIEMCRQVTAVHNN